MKEQESKLNLDCHEPSGSARILDKVVRIVKPDKYELFRRYVRLMRMTDNLVDEGSSYQIALEILTGEAEVLNSFVNNDSTNPLSLPEKELANLIGQIPEVLRPAFIIGIMTY